MEENVQQKLERASIFVCGCIKPAKAAKMKTHWKVFGAGLELNAKLRSLDIECKHCGKTLCIYYDTN